MFERPPIGTRSLLVHINFRDDRIHEELSEFKELVRSTGAEIASVICGSRERPDPRFFVGEGKAREIQAQVRECDIELVIVNHGLSPSQERNLEKVAGARVLSRTGLILDIFAQRAQSHEGKLQVELAQLRHLSTRLVRGWTHLERQKGGIGLRGPGETQLETDRRLIGNRIKLIQGRLKKVSQQRQQGRKTRIKAGMQTVSLVGYTNAGKSTLFNRLTGAGVLAADQLFATLDPTLRRVDLGNNRMAILADTVGFIRHLPHDLVAAFRATLEETQGACLLLHVIDAHDEQRRWQIEQVEQVLLEIGADKIDQIQVYNKCDLLQNAPENPVERDDHNHVKRVWVSAATGEGMDTLLGVIAERLATDMIHDRFQIPVSAAHVRARLFQVGAVINERITDGGWLMELQFQPRFLASLGDDARYLIK